ncbi:acyltransferase [Aureibacillus halotolerans]|uniref:Surface polysaccharide O-acyltransferase-like enzyme n=1 Tax=Aureibacillus halotolerans TaxID=1508390 RepID=A0A4R6TZ05_9BACI|nr:acyltransferase [Aureibacillus halotolerans]TDQ37205.1 surface polysaccharide O-acyltransferase-like enzyme [Aureibacillus halotolerans]
MQAKTKQINEIYVTRAIAILGVLLVHATSFTIIDLQGTSYYGFYNSVNTFFKYGTPTFILLSSFVLFYSYSKRPLTPKLMASFYKRRMLFIILPYIIFSTLYFLYHYNVYASYIPQSEMLGEFLDRLAIGKTSSHLYFVFISIQFYILFPLFLWFFKTFPAVAKHAFWIGFLIQWAFVFALDQGLITVENKGSISLSYMSYYFTGITLGMYFDKFERFLSMTKEALLSKWGVWTVVLWLAWAGTAFGHIYVQYLLRTGLGSPSQLVFQLFWNLHTFFSAFVLLQVSFLIYRKFAPWAVNALMHLGVASFGIYLMHLLVLNEYYAQFKTGDPLLYHIFIAVGFVVTLAVSWLVVGLVLKYVPGAWILFGATPKKMPKKDKTQLPLEPGSSQQTTSSSP